MAVGALVGVAAVLTTVGERRAVACGGEFTPPPPPGETETVTTDHRMILSISPQQTTLWDEIDFTGSPSSFAWVLPIQGTATIGLSADILFASLDSLTATEVLQPALSCPPVPSCDDEGPTAGASGTAEGSGSSGSVTVLSAAQVGPYETVQLQSSSPSALSDWLTTHGYSIPAASSAVIAAYVGDGFNFLAMKLAPGEGITTMRPVRVTTQGASAVLPLRMVAVGTGATTGITLWVVGDGRYEPENFPFFTISDSQLVWDWTTSSSNYDTLRLSQENSLGGKGWQIESSLELAQSSVTNLVTGQQFGGPEQPATGEYLPGGAAVTNGGTDAGSTDAGVGDGGAADGSDAAIAGADLARQQDLSTLFAGIAGPNARFTRIRSDIAHTALTADLMLEASTDQASCRTSTPLRRRPGPLPLPAVSRVHFARLRRRLGLERGVGRRLDWQVGLHEDPGVERPGLGRLRTRREPGRGGRLQHGREREPGRVVGSLGGAAGVRRRRSLEDAAPPSFQVARVSA